MDWSPNHCTARKLPWLRLFGTWEKIASYLLKDWVYSQTDLSWEFLLLTRFCWAQKCQEWPPISLFLEEISLFGLFRGFCLVSPQPLDIFPSSLCQDESNKPLNVSNDCQIVVQQPTSPTSLIWEKEIALYFYNEWSSCQGNLYSRFLSLRWFYCI